jgi:hypothetical protein
LDVTGGRVVKGVNFVNLIDAGDPVQCAIEYDRQGADEIVFLDITASSDNRNTMVDVVRRTAENVFIPVTVGGGIRKVEDCLMLNSAPTRSPSTPPHPQSDRIRAGAERSAPRRRPGHRRQTVKGGILGGRHSRRAPPRPGRRRVGRERRRARRRRDF